MKTQEILSIVALSLLGLCLLCGLAKMAMRGDSAKKNCDKACSMAVFAAVVLLAISQLIGETDGYCEIMPLDNGHCHTIPDGACGPSNTKPSGETNWPCPNADKCGTIANYCGEDSECPPAGTGAPARRATAAWWTNKCGPPWSSN